jgi:hypothetical protein
VNGRRERPGGPTDDAASVVGADLVVDGGAAA